MRWSVVMPTSLRLRRRLRPSHKLGFPGGRAATDSEPVAERGRPARPSRRASSAHCHARPGRERAAAQVLRHRCARLMPVDAAFVATADPETLLFTGAYAEDPLDAATAAVPGQRVRRRATSTGSPRSPRPAARRVAGRRHPRTTARQPALPRHHAPLGLGDELRARPGRRTGAAGATCACTGRTAGSASPPGGGHLIARLGPHLAARAAPGPPAAWRGARRRSQRPGRGAARRRPRPWSRSPRRPSTCSRWSTTRPRAPPLPVAVYTVAAALAALERGTPDAGGPAHHPDAHRGRAAG